MTTATFEVKIGKEVYEVDAKDENEAWQLANSFHASTPLPPPPEKSTGESILFIDDLKDDQFYDLYARRKMYLTK